MTERQIQRYRNLLLKYLEDETPEKQCYSPELIFQDVLYLMGIAIDEQKYGAAQGFDEFKLLLTEIIKGQNRNKYDF
ncbi:hypothetical protein GV054_08985 [Marinomonas mediterranea]|jgi:hypothetical protein|uniref:Uncharacterized protein n=1 Tax=Marinomonas mediterranea (strain ATCC 700492 / JCM 21426 / NBRC 103028 / MMB-1) TaxID=717774 RepID=F2K1D5_MARM1|nr:hypothetical protein [Marinomonas mediterranea]ADZ91066.1 hypothetical protein Marme_1810 [Marinomonas mediterranea MMB-1]WCN13131.1 hypothetical protein GV054_08985 [Marinomonas mediterranea]WCN17202.1 hypothetical protein GV053_09150 [Marinomonas mediterranea MMB-1]